MPRVIDPRSFFGFSGQPLPVSEENVPISQQMRDRFKAAGQESFLPYISPWETLAQGQQYRDADHALAVKDAENTLFDEQPQTPSALQDLVRRNPVGATLSPMFQVYQQRMNPAAKTDPYEAIIAREGGADHLAAYRTARAKGQDPAMAFAEHRDEIMRKQAAAKRGADLRMFFAEHGGDLEDLPALQAQGADNAALLEYIRKKGKPPTEPEARRLTEAQSDLAKKAAAFDSPEGDDQMKAMIEKKRTAFNTKYGRDPKTEQEWQEAHFLGRAAHMRNAQETYDDIISALQDSGKRVPDKSRARTAAPAAPDTPQPSTPTTAPSTKAVTETTAQRLLREAREALKAK